MKEIVEGKIVYIVGKIEGGPKGDIDKIWFCVRGDRERRGERRQKMLLSG